MKKINFLFIVLLSFLCSTFTSCGEIDEPSGPPPAYFNTLYYVPRGPDRIVYLDDNVYLNFTSSYIAANGAYQIGYGWIYQITDNDIFLYDIIVRGGHNYILKFSSFVDTVINYDQGVVLKADYSYYGRTVYYTIVFDRDYVWFVRTPYNPIY